MTGLKESRRQHRKELIESIDYSGNLKMTVSEKAKMEIFTSCLEDLEDSINRNSDSSHKLATKVFWLNVILTIATIAGTVIAVMTFFK
jgi:Mg2+/citrate symporter